METSTVHRHSTGSRGPHPATCHDKWVASEQMAVYEKDCVEKFESLPKGPVPNLDGHEGAAALTFSAGRVSGKDIVTVGGRLEGGKTLAEGENARLASVGAVGLGVGNALLVGGGLGLKAELGPKNWNVYGTAMGTLNAGVTTDGLTGGVGLRGAVGGQLGPIYGEVAHEKATNLSMTSVSAGLRLRF